MDRTVSRRTLLGAAAGTASAGLAGCFGLFGCEKGEETIEEIAADLEQRAGEDVTVKGELTSLTSEVAKVDDGTGTAAVTPGPLSKWDTTSMDSGACVTATGRLLDGGGDYNTDIVLFNGSVFKND